MEKMSLSGRNFMRDLPSRDQKSRIFKGSRTSFYKQQNEVQEHPYSANILNLQVDEQQFISNTKIELMQIQENINKMDYDSKLRQTQPNDLEKPYVKEIKKFLNRFHSINGNQQLDQKMKIDINDTDLLSFLNVKSSEEGLKKLIRIIWIMDVLVTKLTEQQLVSLLKYDQLYDDLCGQKLKKDINSKINQIGQGLQISRFHSFGANLERYQELFAYSSKLLNINEAADTSRIIKSDNSKVRAIQTLEDLQVAVQSDLFELNNVQKQKLNEIMNKVSEQQVVSSQKMEKQNQQITYFKEKVDKLKKQIENQEQTLNTTRSSFFQANNEDDSQYYLKIVQELETDFKTKVCQIERDNDKLSQQNEELKLKVNKQQQMVMQIQDDMTEQLKVKEQMIKEIKKNYKTDQDFQDSYEDALRESFEKIRDGYEKKLDEKDEEITKLQRQKNIEVHEMKSELQREKDTKSLLLKKLSLFIKI